MKKIAEVGAPLKIPATKIFELNDQDIELIVRLLHHECDNHVYDDYAHGEIGDSLKASDVYFKERYDHIQDLIMELTK